MLAAIVELLRLRQGAEEAALRQVLHGLPDGERALCVLAFNLDGKRAPLLQALRRAGGEIFKEEDLPGPPDVICAGPPPGDLATRLAGWARQVRPGGVVILLSHRGTPPRTRLCAAFLHAGLGEPVQHVSGLSALTAGRSAAKNLPSWASRANPDDGCVEKVR